GSRWAKKDVGQGFPWDQVVHKNVWGFEGLPLESPRLPSHIGTVARKHGWRRERQRFCARRWEISNFGLFQSVKDMVTTGGCGHASRASFCVVKIRGADSGFKSWISWFRPRD